jgi:hypothetical protein
MLESLYRTMMAFPLDFAALHEFKTISQTHPRSAAAATGKGIRSEGVRSKKHWSQQMPQDRAR